MDPRKLNVLIVTFPNAGNGGISSQADEVGDWVTETMLKCQQDARVGWCKKSKISDTPITMTRNRAVVFARENGADVLVMVDSDMHPDKRVHDGAPDAKPFWDTSFDFLYRHWDRGPVVIGAPYCGPPPNEPCYVFQWASKESDGPGLNCALQAYSREHAAAMKGIQQCAALPTGLIMFDVRIFSLTEPRNRRDEVLDRLMEPVRAQMAGGMPITLDQARELVGRTIDAKERAEQSWFYYEWTDRFQQEKASTEDVTATRDMAAHGILELGYNPLRVNWDAWAGHWKPKCVDKPGVLTSSDVNNKLIRAAQSVRSRTMRFVELDKGVPVA